MATHGLARLPTPANEPVLEYAPGSPEREELRRRLQEFESQRLDIPCIIGGEEVRTGKTTPTVMPHRREHVLADVHQGGEVEVERAIAAAAEAWHDWSRTPWEERAAVLLRAAELLAGPRRSTLVAATMLNQSKTAHQAETDAACELADFWRFNPLFMTRIYEEQPLSSPGVWNRLDYRPLEGFIFAHPSADVDALATAIVRGSFEYQGQKCSAASRVYAPASLWPALRERLAEQVATIKVGDVADFSNFMGAVIDASSFATQREAIEEAKTHAD